MLKRIFKLSLSFQTDEENSDTDRHVAVKNTETGEILQGENAPKFSNLDTWLEMHPNFQVENLWRCLDLTETGNPRSILRLSRRVQYYRFVRLYDSLTRRVEGQRALKSRKMFWSDFKISTLAVSTRLSFE